MGVTGLWKLLEQSGKPVPLETLENKILAVDISIWLHQVVKGFQDNKGNALAQAHLLGLFHRLCKLLYYKIKPVFVFDGSTPLLKRETIAKRQQGRNQIINEADRLQALLLQSLAKEKIVQQALGANAAELISPSKKSNTNEKPEKEDIFKLPDLPAIIEETPNSSTSSWVDYDSSSDSSFEEHNLRYAYQNNIQSINVKSAEFINLPPDVRHEILTDIRETRKQSSWGKLHELPAESNQFSSYQMKRLLKRRQVQVSLEEAEKEMGGKTLTLNEMRSFLTEEGIVAAASESANKPVASDENTRYLLVRDLTKKIEKLEKDKLNQPGTSKMEKTEDEIQKPLGDEYDEDLELAIKMSLEEADGIYKDEDYDCDSNVKLNRQQRKNLQNSALSLARNYMIEYGGMNDDDIKDLLQQTQVEDTNENLDKSLSFMYNDKSILATAPTPEIKKIDINLTKNVEPLIEKTAIETISDSDYDSDFEEVKEISTNKLSIDTKIQLHIDLTKTISQEDDIFADIFDDGDTKPITLSSEIEEHDEKIVKTNSHLPLDKIRDNLEEIDKDQYKSEVSETKKFDIIESNSKSNLTTVENEILLTDKLSLDANKERISELKNQDGNTNHKSSENLEIQSKNINAANILEHLQKEVSEITKLNLDDIKINSSTIEIYDSDDTELVSKKPPKNLNEIIEITDNDDSINNFIINQVQKTPSKKDGKINGFFETKYTVKRTPDKQIEDVNKVKSPFFINKSPCSSGKKRKKEQNLNSDDETEEISGKRTSKSSKMLFAEEKIDEQINTIELAVKTLKDNKTVDELENMAIDLAQEKNTLEHERNRQDRMGISITEKMNRECMELLRLFGIPYIIAPMEAEAQCAFLNAIELTDGTITDDSDIWLFGGRTVYKNFFNQKKHVLEYKFENIEKLFNVNRHTLIQLAMLVGSDYTTGINGIGAVTALEILATFTPTPVKDNETTEVMSILSSLRKFREWWKNGRTVGPGGRTTLKNKLKNIDLIEGFPNIAVVEAYLRPKIDENRENFTWSAPDTESLREFAKKRLGWTRMKTDEILGPVIKKIEEKKSQKSIKDFFNIKNTLIRQDLKVSKRVQKAINKMSADYKSDDEPKIKKSRGRKANKILENTVVDGESSNVESKPKNKRKKKSLIVEPTASTSPENCNLEYNETSGSIPEKIPKKSVNIPESKVIIPQKEKDLIEMEERKKTAAKIFKKSNVKSVVKK